MKVKTVYSRGFELLSKRQEKDSVQLALNRTEIPVPQLYRNFVTCFAVESMRQGDFVVCNDQRIRVSQAVYSTENIYDADKDKICFMEYYAPANLLVNLNEEDELKRKLLYPVAECLHNGVVCVGYGTDNYDKVYVELPSSRIEYLCENVFEFQFNLGLVFLDDSVHGVDTSKIYKTPFSKYFLI